MTNMVAVKTMTKTRLSLKVQTAAAIVAVIAAVAIPQIFHVMGAMSGLGTGLGEAFLPMHLPIILVGLLAGPYAGAVAGFIGPIVSFALSGMPGFVMLPFMMVELCVYGLVAGLLRTVKLPVFVKVVLVQIAGRIARGAAIVFAVFVLGNESIRVASIWMSIGTGIFGLVLQWILLPLIVYRVENLKRYEK